MGDGDGVAETPSFPVYQVVMETENMNYGYDIRGFTLCDAADDGPGGVYVWWLNDDELYDGTLSDNEAANFDNTDLIPTSLPFTLTDDAGMFRTFTYQHDLERDYPIKRHLHRQCFCDWTKLGTPVPKKPSRRSSPASPSSSPAATARATP